MIITAVDGTLELKDQLRDYKYRGEESAHMNFFDFMLETYEGSMEVNADVSGPDQNADDENNDDETPRSRGRGRPLSARIPYQDEARKGKRARIQRSKGHETLPRFVGKWFSRSDTDSEKDMHRASMLMLLKPWRNLQELKDNTETFEDAYSRFMAQADEKIHRVVTNIQYYYECSDGAKAEREKANANPQPGNADADDTGRPEFAVNVDEREVDEIYAAINSEEEITDDDIERAQLMTTDARERLYSQSAVWLGYDVGFFEDAEPSTGSTRLARAMKYDEAEKITAWEKQLKATACEQMNEFGTINIADEINEVGSLIAHADPVETAEMMHDIRATVPEVQQQGGEEGVTRVELAKLNEQQRRAHDIIEEKLKEHLAGEFKKKKKQ